MGDPIKLTRRGREVAVTDGGERRRAGHTYIASPGSELEGTGERRLSKTRPTKKMGEVVVYRDSGMSENVDVHQNVDNNWPSEMEDGKGGEEEGNEFEECDEDGRTYNIGEHEETDDEKTDYVSEQEYKTEKEEMEGGRSDHVNKVRSEVPDGEDSTHIRDDGMNLI
ncbi:hypothetical protein ZOSMA_223G00430 [Zostera marina]|uniref:Uncharacterized protein n=1 Tax=Zostera marina TaxID=29655 RepID=A0A0K9PJA8_ZOSMR|nr:hypothetical protein ZOSMA_223G00430 [Zostera marina]